MWLVVIGAAGGAAYTWWRERQATSGPIDPPQWPPVHDAAANIAATATDIATTNLNTADAAVTNTSTTDVPGLVNALVDTPDARSTSADGTWVLPNDDASCPDGFPIKANDNSGIYHVPTGRFYARTKAERCYATAAGAEADGYRAAKS